MTTPPHQKKNVLFQSKRKIVHVLMHGKNVPFLKHNVLVVNICNILFNFNAKEVA